MVCVRPCKAQPEDEKQRGKRIRIIKKTARCIGICGAVFLCNRKLRGIPCYTKGTDMPMMRTRAKTDVNYRFFLKNSSAFRNMIPSASSFDIPFSRKYP